MGSPPTPSNFLLRRAATVSPTDEVGAGLLGEASSFLRRARSISQTTRIDMLNRPNSGPAISICDRTSGPGVRMPPTTAERISAYLLNFHRLRAVTSPSQPSTASTTGSSNATPVPSSIASMKPTSSSIFTIGSILKGSVPVTVWDRPKRNVRAGLLMST